MAKTPPSSEGMAGIEPAPRRPIDLVDREIVRDGKLSYRALGVAVRLLSNAPGYRMDSSALAEAGEGREGRDAIRTALRELDDAGYLTRERVRIPGGQWITRVTITDRLFAPCSPTPVFQAPAPTPEKPVPGNPTVGGIGPKSRYGSRLSNRETETTTTAIAVTDLIWPSAIVSNERVVVVRRYFGGLAASTAQGVLDELAGRVLLGRPPDRVMSWLAASVAKARRDEFVLDAGRSICEARNRAAAEAKATALRQQTAARKQDPATRERDEAAAHEAMVSIAQIFSRPRRACT